MKVLCNINLDFFHQNLDEQAFLFVGEQWFQKVIDFSPCVLLLLLRESSRSAICPDIFLDNLFYSSP